MVKFMKAFALLYFAVALAFLQPVFTGSGTAQTNQITVLSSFRGEDREPALSPDGKWLAHLSDRKEDRSNELWLMGFETGTHQPLLTEGIIAGPPAWMPNGQQILVSVRGPDGLNKIRSVDVATGSVSAPLFPNNHNGNQMFADVSPDGKHVAFTLADAGNNTGLDLYMGAIDTGHVTQLTHHPENDLWPRFTNAGKQLVFFSRRDTGGESDDIYIMDIACRHVTRLTDTEDHDFVPAPSPDGRFIAFSSRREGTPELYVMNLDGTGQRRLSPTGLNVTHPVWSQDGKRLYATVRPATGGPADIAAFTFH